MPPSRTLMPRRSLLAAGSLALLAGCAGGAAPAAPGALDEYPPMDPGPETGADPAVHAFVNALGRGINFGNMLEPPREGDWGLRVEDHFIDLVGTGGFTRSVRLPVRWSNHAGTDARATIDPAFMARVDSVVTRLLARGATVVLDMHHYRQLDGDALDPGETAVDPAVVELRFLALWQQIAEHFAGHGPGLLFEIYNEPHGRLEPLWNDLLSRALRVIRRSNPGRLVVVGPVQWNSAAALPKLVLPPDRRLVLTVHHYEPFGFTHQGAEWVQPPRPLGLDCCTAEQQRQMNEPLDLAMHEARRRGYPIFVGEFGAYGKAPLPARLAYLRLMRDAMERRGLPWMYWELAAGFGLYDPMARRFRAEPLEALFSP